MLFARPIMLVGLVCTLLTACSTVPKETAKGRAVQVIKSPFAETCIQVGRIKYEGTPFVRDKELLIILKENAAKLGGNALRLDRFTPGVTGVSNAKGLGTSYKCHPAKLKAYILKTEYGDAGAEGESEYEEIQEEETPPAATKGKAKPKAAKPARKVAPAN